MVVIACRVVLPCRADAVVSNHATYGVEPLTIGTILTFLIVSETIESHILLAARTRGGSKGIGLRGLLGNLTPLGGGKSLTAINGHAALVELLAITQNVLAHLTQIKIEITAILGSRTVLTGIDKGIEHPKLNILDIGLFEVVGIDTSHHAAPLRLWL